MNPQGFSFPPPPPPPPPQQHPPQPHHPHNTGFTPYGQGHHAQRGGGSGGGAQFRGRGRGYGNRGGGRGGHYVPSDANRPGTYPTNTSVGYGPMTYPGYTNQPIPSHFTQSSSSNFQNSQPQNATPYASQRTYPQPSAVHADATYSQVAPVHQHAPPAIQPAMMGPPMRWGFETPGPSGSFAGPQRQTQRGGRPFNAYNHQNSQAERSVKHANKRDHSSAFGKPQSVTPRVPAPPPVPSFGNPLPSKPPPPADSPRKSKKKKRKHNQLGLTPKTEEHESSEEEDDADEESRFAAGGAAAGTGLQVTYKGRTSTLQTNADIAAWIAERKKRFPTQAKIEEKKKGMEEAKKAREEAQKQRLARKQTTKREKKEQEKHNAKEPTGESLDPMDAAARAKKKADKLRRKLMKEEKRIAQAEADAARARLRLEEAEQESRSTVCDVQSQPISSDNVDNDQDPEDPGKETRRMPVEPGSNHAGDVNAVVEPSSEMSDSSDWTSSSGSDLSSSDSDESDDEAPPEETSSRREGPERVPAPSREAKKNVCRQFARNGRCSRGNKCKFLHAMADRGVKAKPVEKHGRRGLLQALLDRQKEEENRKVMQMILWLGENGHLGEPEQAIAVVGNPELEATPVQESNVSVA
ncbi:hypothetical protein ARAM_001807 [Aspergillus rambellii]|uniref:C3H1-type domain-containing protein n=1 Tax=Aspergillus rambellii TaxID=308745 RepID=A0A0F8U9M8_9EURO|nr:hypothetical protein ARAM_001807 [Aspergillus rambellii]